MEAIEIGRLFSAGQRRDVDRVVLLSFWRKVRQVAADGAPLTTPRPCDVAAEVEVNSPYSPIEENRQGDTRTNSRPATVSVQPGLGPRTRRIPSERTDSRIRVCHLAMADVQGGAEIQLAVLLASLAKMPDLEISVVLLNDGGFASQLKDLGVKVDVILESRHNFLVMVKELADYFKREEIDILHTHKYKDNVLGTLASLPRGIRVRVRTVHGSPEPYIGFEAAKMAVYEKLDYLANRWFVDRILAVSFDLHGQLIRRYGAEKVTCVHNGVNIEQVHPSKSVTELRRELGISERDFVIGTIGRLVPVKGQGYLLKAARLIQRQRPNVKCIIAGDGPLKSSLQATAHEYNLGNNVLFLGHRSDVYDILRLMDVFVLPSLSEGIPMALLEALALGRPVVASRVGGIPEVIQHGVTGLLTTPENEEELAQNCMAVMDDLKLGQTLGAAGQRRIEEEFSAGVMADKVAEIYRTLVSGGISR